jgi:3-methyladenine DNA glycosylase Mpg
LHDGGRRYQIPVAYMQDGTSILIASRARWWKNLCGGTPVEVLLRGRHVAGTAEVSEEVAQREADLRRVLRGANQVARFMEVTLDQAGAPDPSERAAALERGWMVVRVQVPPRVSPAPRRSVRADRTQADDETHGARARLHC